jgi:hypothetical protein
VPVGDDPPAVGREHVGVEPGVRPLGVAERGLEPLVEDGHGERRVRRPRDGREGGDRRDDEERRRDVGHVDVVLRPVLAGGEEPRDGARGGEVAGDAGSVDADVRDGEVAHLPCLDRAVNYVLPRGGGRPVTVHDGPSTTCSHGSLARYLARGRLSAMVRTSRVVLGALGLVAAGAVVARAIESRRTSQVPYTVVGRVGAAELRRYPAAVTVETVADTDEEAFGRLYRYIEGANDGGERTATTAPVAASGGARLPMTAPVLVAEEETTAEEGVRMAFWLPADYGVETAPRPTDDRVRVVAVPERTLAVRRFGGRATPRRVERERDRLLRDVDRAATGVVGDPFYMGYDAPWTLPVLRRNEVGVVVHER